MPERWDGCSPTYAPRRRTIAEAHSSFVIALPTWAKKTGEPKPSRFANDRQSNLHRNAGAGSKSRTTGSHYSWGTPYGVSENHIAHIHAEGAGARGARCGRRRLNTKGAVRRRRSRRCVGRGVSEQIAALNRSNSRRVDAGQDRIQQVRGTRCRRSANGEPEMREYSRKTNVVS